MDMDKFVSLASRVMFAVAVLALAVGVVEKIANLSGYTVTRSYTPERLLELSVAFAVITLVFQVRQLRVERRRAP